MEKGGRVVKEEGVGTKGEGESACLCSLLPYQFLCTFSIEDEDEPSSGLVSSPQLLINSCCFRPCLLDTTKACLISLIVTSQPYQHDKLTYHTTMAMFAGAANVCRSHV